MNLRLFRHPLSGHAHRAELMLSLLGLPFESIDVDLVSGAQRQASFLARNPLGQVPVLEDGDVIVPDSNAILVYLASRYDPSGRWLPREPVAAAQVQRWLGVAAGPLLQGPAMARIEVMKRLPRDPQRHSAAATLFQVMDMQLASGPFITGASPTIADVALYTYTRHAPEGGVPLAPYPHLSAWLARIEALPGFIGMHKLPDAPALGG